MVSGVFENKTLKSTPALFSQISLCQPVTIWDCRGCFRKIWLKKINEIYRRFQFWLKLDRNNDILYESLHAFITLIRKHLSNVRLISNFHHVLNIVCFLLADSPAPEFYMLTFRNTLSARTYLPMKMEQSVPKRRHIKFKRRGITQKKAHNTLMTYRNGKFPESALQRKINTFW